MKDVRKLVPRTPPEGLLEYFLSRGGDKLDYDVQKFCAEHFGETIDWLTGELGVLFKETVSKKGKDPVPRGHNCANNAMDALRAVTARRTRSCPRAGSAATSR